MVHLFDILCIPMSYLGNFCLIAASKGYEYESYIYLFVFAQSLDSKKESVDFFNGVYSVLSGCQRFLHFNSSE